MRLLIAIPSAALLISLANWPGPGSFGRSALGDSLFDQYGAIRWKDEKARLNNFAIQLQQDEKLVGYILVFDAVGGCAGEAQARAIRAKRYVVEHRGISWDRVIWRREGYRWHKHDPATGFAWDGVAFSLSWLGHRRSE